MVKWTTVLRPGYSGFNKEKLKKEWDEKFGKGWRVVWEVEGKFIERAQVFSICEQAYFADSFNNGETNIELNAGKVELVSKGYIKLYEELTGKKVLG